MIEFELPAGAKATKKLVHGLAAGMFRNLSRKYDSYEHEHDTVEELQSIAQMMAQGMGGGSAKKKEKKEEEKPEEKEKKSQKGAGVTMVVAAEEMCWGDAGLMLAIPGRGLGNAAIDAVATPEQKERFGQKYAAMAITEPGAGSDSSAISTTAALDEKTNEWILNGEKIFVTGGEQAGAIVVWATLDKSKGRQAIKSFVVEKGTPGMTLTKLEDKLGIRASDTAAIVFEDCRIPYDNILGSPEIKPEGGFKGVMKTFDNTRPLVAAMALGVARAALEFTKDRLEEEGFTFPYTKSHHELSLVQREVMDMEANLEVARLLTWRAASMLDTGERNSLEASMAKAKAGRAATQVTQKCVELLGPKGYSTELLVEKWMRDCKINDIFEGTGQIQMLIIARNILGYGRDMLK
ncbi:MAG: acyl-CoA dehydrogenase family protein [bacterium]